MDLFGVKYLKYQRLGKRFNSKRIFEIDFLRGFDILLMITVHFCFAASSTGLMGILFDKHSASNGTIQAMNLFCGNVFTGIVNPIGIENPFGEGRFCLFFLEIFFSGLFVFLSGVSCSFARNNASRAFQLAYVAELMTVLLITASVIIRWLGGNTCPVGDNSINCKFWNQNPQICIILGILQSIAIALLIYSLFDRFFNKFYQTFIAAIFWSIIAIITAYFATDLETGYLHVATLPRDWWKLLLGLARYGDDYFSPTQVTATLFLGASFGKLFYADRKSLLPASFKGKWATPVLFLGRHSLAIYIFHMPIMYGLLMLIYLLAGYKIKGF